jgi:hypothetical protein
MNNAIGQFPASQEFVRWIVDYRLSFPTPERSEAAMIEFA